MDIDYDEGVDALMALHGDRPSNHGSVRASSVGSTSIPATTTPTEKEDPIPSATSAHTETGMKRNDPTSPRSPSSVLSKKPKPTSPNQVPIPKKTFTIEVLNAGNVRSPPSLVQPAATSEPGANGQSTEAVTKDETQEKETTEVPVAEDASMSGAEKPEPEEEAAVPEVVMEENKEMEKEPGKAEEKMEVDPPQAEEVPVLPVKPTESEAVAPEDVVMDEPSENTLRAQDEEKKDVEEEVKGPEQPTIPETVLNGGGATPA